MVHAPKITEPFIIQVDASDFAVGTCVAQNYENIEKHPIAFLIESVPKSAELMR